MSQTSEVGLFTFYAYIGRHGSKIPIQPSLDHLPHDWPELKEHLLDRVRKAYLTYNVVEAQWSFERHVSSRMKVYRQTIRSYRPRAFHWARNALAYFVIEYIEHSDTIRIKQASFSPALSRIAQEYREEEKGEKYAVKPVVPQTYKSLAEDPLAIIRELSALRYPDYSKTQRPKYGKEPREFHSSLGSYVPFGQRLKESR